MLAISRLSIIFALTSSVVMAAPISPSASKIMKPSQPIATPSILPKTPLTSNNIQIRQRSEVEGLWGMHIESNPQCVEYYNFKADDQMAIKSDQEWSVGQYQYQPAEEANALALMQLHIQYDNNQKDCSGQQQDQSNEVQQFYIKWTQPRQIQFCGDAKGTQCFATLNKQLP